MINYSKLSLCVIINLYKHINFIIIIFLLLILNLSLNFLTLCDHLLAVNLVYIKTMHELPDCLLYAPVDLLLRIRLIRHYLTLQRLLTLDLVHAVQLAQGLANKVSFACKSLHNLSSRW